MLCMCESATGETFRFDWSEDWAVIGGERVKLQVAHTKLSHSRAFLVRACLLQTHVPLVTCLLWKCTVGHSRKINPHPRP